MSALRRSHRSRLAAATLGRATRLVSLAVLHRAQVHVLYVARQVSVDRVRRDRRTRQLLRRRLVARTLLFARARRTRASCAEDGRVARRVHLLVQCCLRAALVQMQLRTCCRRVCTTILPPINTSTLLVPKLTTQIVS